MTRTGKTLAAVGIAALVALPTGSAEAYRGWGGPWDNGWYGEPHGWSYHYKYRRGPHYWQDSYKYDPGYRFAPAAVRSDIRRAHRYGYPLGGQRYGW